MGKAIGVIEFRSIGKGIEATDAMTKRADVQIIDNRMICIGKYFVIVTGEVAALKDAIDEGEYIAGDTLIGSKVIPSVADGVLEKVNAKFDSSDIDALGIFETKDLSSGVYGANYIKKSSNVELLKISLTLGLGGKAIVLFTGDVASVNSALSVAKEKVSPEKVVSAINIPSPSKELISNL